MDRSLCRHLFSFLLGEFLGENGWIVMDVNFSEKEREHLSHFPLLGHQPRRGGSTLKTLITSQKAPPPNIFMLGVRSSTYEFAGDSNKYSVHDSHSNI